MQVAKTCGKADFVLLDHAKVPLQLWRTDICFVCVLTFVYVYVRIYQCMYAENQPLRIEPKRIDMYVCMYVSYACMYVCVNNILVFGGSYIACHTTFVVHLCVLQSMYVFYSACA